MTGPAVARPGGTTPVLALLAPLLLGACVIYRNVRVEELPRSATTVTAPVKAHLVDGATVIFRSGVTISATEVTGRGTRYSLDLGDSTPVPSIPLSMILGMETYRSGVDPGGTFVASVLATGIVIGGAVAIACAADPKCFGSCPTFYSDSAGVELLEAEGFSYSIAPLFEMRDVDRLRATADARGVVRLDVRNEAFETHYINHLELLEVAHAADEVVVPDARGVPVAVRDLAPPATARDRAGRDVRAVLADHDGIAFRTAPARLASVTADDHDDIIELSADVGPGADSVAVVLRLRNSLLNTVLLYDVMLGDRGAYALTYLAADLQEIGTAVELGQWYVEELGMRVEVLDDGTWRQAGRFLDTGPVAWKDIAVVVPVPHATTTLRLRLRSVADNWRIDQVRIGGSVRRPATRTLPLARAIDARGREDTTVVASLRAADERYLETSASQRFWAEFDAGPSPAAARTFFLASQGYYIEWIRQEWLARGQERMPFRPGPDALVSTLRRWREMQADYERQFAATRVPVR